MYREFTAGVSDVTFALSSAWVHQVAAVNKILLVNL